MAGEFHAEYDVFVGRDMGGHQYTVTPELVQVYEDGTDDHNEWYHTSSPFGGAVAPPLLFHSEVYKNLAWYLPNLIGNLHAKQEWDLFHPMLVGETVHMHSTVVDRYVKRNREYVVNEVLISDTSGRWLQRSRTHQSFLIEESRAGFVVDKDREKRPDRRFVVGEGSGPELSPAMRARIRQIDWRQARADVVRFVAAREQEGLRAWSVAFFSQLLEQLAAYLPER